MRPRDRLSGAHLAGVQKSLGASPEAHHCGRPLHFLAGLAPPATAQRPCPARARIHGATVRPSGPRGNCARRPPRGPARPGPAEAPPPPDLCSLQGRAGAGATSFLLCQWGKLICLPGQGATFHRSFLLWHFTHSAGEHRPAGKLWVQSLGFSIQNSRQLVITKSEARTLSI